MSRGPGRCQRRVIELLEGSPEHKLSRAELDAVLVGEEGYDPSNVLRAVRRLGRVGLVHFSDHRYKCRSMVRLPPPVERVPETKIMELLRGGQCE